MLLLGLKETVYMVFLSSFLSYVIGIPLGILLVVTDRDGIQPNIIVNTLLGVVINILRSVPFIIMLLAVLPITRFIVLDDTPNRARWSCRWSLRPRPTSPAWWRAP